MSKGKKLLRASILTLLLALCIAVAVIFIVHLTGSDDGDVADPRIRDRGNADAQTEDSGIVFSDIKREQTSDEEGFRFWQRVMSISEETGLWYYYPIIPWDVQPGEVAVLGVSVVGFQGWEVDPNFAHVELFDETSDNENVYVSFIMPDKEPSIAALYDEKPYINIENTRNMIMSMEDMRELGDGPITPSSVIVVPLPDNVRQTLIRGYLGEDYYVAFSNPDIEVPAGMEIAWNWNFPLPALAGLKWNYFYDPETGATNGGFIDGEPETIGGPINFYVDLGIRPIGDPGPGATVFRGLFRVTIGPPGQDPVILTTNVPHAMVDVLYDVRLETGNFPSGSTWEIVLPIDGNVPAGLGVYTNASGSDLAVRGTPLPAALTSGTAGTANHVFSFTLNQTNPASDDWLVPSPEYRITVYPRPTISISQPTFFDGLVDYPYNPSPFPGVPTINNIISASPAPATLPGMSATPPTWEFLYTDGSDELDYTVHGIGLLVDPSDPSRIAITGTPTEAAVGEHNITLRFISTDEDLIIGYTLPVPFTIKIWPRPVISASPNPTAPLPDGMVGPPSPNTLNEPRELYDTSIMAVGPLLSELSSRTWGLTTGSLPPGFVLASPGTLETGTIRTTISGETFNTTLAGDYNFTAGLTLGHLNPNINNAVIERPFSIRIWNRAYLIGWTTPVQIPESIFANRVDEGDWQPNIRAVIPGTEGQIRAMTTQQFMIWTPVDPNPILPPSAVITPPPDGIPVVGQPAAPGIGDNWRIDSDSLGTWARVWVTMPKPAAAADTPLHVRLTGLHTPVPTVTANFMNPGMEGVSPYFGQIDVNTPRPPELQALLLESLWGVVNPGFVAGDGLPPGLTMPSLPGSGPGVISGTPTTAGTYNFNIGLTLPGGMRISYPNPRLPNADRYTINILPFTAVIGDVDGSGAVDLRDLYLLRLRVLNALTGQDAIIFKDANADINGDGNINSTDLEILATWFTGDGIMPVPTAAP